MLVEELIRDHRWDRSWVERVLWSVDHDVLYNIPLCEGDKAEQLVWHYDAKGEYNVKFGYRVIMNQKFGEGQSGVSGDVGWWHKLWSA